MNHFDLLRGLHIIAVIAWMAGMMYLPRLFAYHTETAPPGAEFDKNFLVWERKLLKIIINPAMILAFIFGGWLLWLRSGDGADWSFAHQPWMVTKLIGVFLLAGWHGFLAGQRKKIAAGASKYSGRFWRMTNEIPFVLAIIMVLSVTLEWTF